MVGQSDNPSFAQDLLRDVRRWLVGLLVDEPEDCRDGLPEGLFRLPAGERFGDGVDEGDSASGVACDHSVADTRKRHPQPFALLAYDLLLFRDRTSDGPAGEQGEEHADHEKQQRQAAGGSEVAQRGGLAGFEIYQWPRRASRP